MTQRVKRRAFLCGAGALLMAPRLEAIGPGSKLKIAQIKYKGNWDPRPDAARIWAQEVRFRTSVDVNQQRVPLELDDPNLFFHPLMLLLGDGRFRFTAEKRGRLKKWIEAGGFLFIDNTGRSEPSDEFDAAVRAEIKAIFPGRPLEKIPPQHVLYRTFYRLDFPAGRALHRTYMEGVFIEDRLAVLYCQNDLTGALDRDNFGGWRYDVIPLGEDGREKALRLAINVVQYAMCLDYKDDQVHLDWLLHKRRWRIKPPVIETP